MNTLNCKPGRAIRRIRREDYQAISYAITRAGSGVSFSDGRAFLEISKALSEVRRLVSAYNDLAERHETLMSEVGI